MLPRIFGVLATALVLFIPVQAQIVSSGTVEIPGTDSFDFDLGSIQLTGDVFWEQFTSTTRALVASDGAGLVNLGAVNFANLTAAQLQALTYSTSASIDGSNGTSLLVVGDVFAVHTHSGNYAKAIVTAAFDPQINGLTIQWVTYAPPGPPPTPAPPTLLLIATGFAALLAFQYRRKLARLL